MMALVLCNCTETVLILHSTAPAVSGKTRGNWKLKNTNIFKHVGLFGIFFMRLLVNFPANFDSASWRHRET